MNETTPIPPRRQPDWALVVLFLLLAGAAVYAIYYAFATQATLNRQLAAQNLALAKRLTTLEAVQRSSVKADMLEALKTALAESHATIGTLESRLALLEKTASAPAPTIRFTTTATETETLSQFLALQRAVEKGDPFTDEWLAASTTPEVASVKERLEPLAATGVLSEQTLRDQLATWLEEHPATVIVPDATLDRFNHRLKGLLTIRRKEAAPVDAYATLRTQVAAEASLDLLITSVAALPDEAAAPLGDWLAKARTRQEALTALHAAAMALTESSH